MHHLVFIYSRPILIGTPRRYMKEIVRRTLIVLWLAAIAGVVYNIFQWGVVNLETWQISALFVMPIWALQFLLTGIVNPLLLMRKKPTPLSQ
jgi:drug/metabolite transporter (DMT)-like permease